MLQNHQRQSNKTRIPAGCRTFSEPAPRRDNTRRFYFPEPFRNQAGTWTSHCPLPPVYASREAERGR
jgi:hypothetical protein